MGPVLVPLFPPNSAKNAHLNSISRPRVMFFVTGEKVLRITRSLFYASTMESLLLSPQGFFHSRFYHSTFKFPPDFPFYSWHFLPFLFVSASSSVQPRPPAHCCLTFLVKDLFSLFTNPSQPGCTPVSSLNKPLVNSTFWPFFLANHRSSRQGQVVAPGWSVWLESPPAFLQSLPECHKCS